jgi:hypothetical protein
MLAFQSSASNGIKNLRAGGAFLYRQREREAAGDVVIVVPLVPRIRGPRTPFTRCVSSWVFLGEVHHERTKQTLARVRPGSTGDSARGYERSRVPRPEHLNSWQAGRNYSITSPARASNAHGTVPCGNPICRSGMRFLNGFSLLMIPRRRVARALRICAGNEVRKLYKDVPNEPIPAKIADLLHRLDQ